MSVEEYSAAQRQASASARLAADNEYQAMLNMYTYCTSQRIIPTDSPAFTWWNKFLNEQEPGATDWAGKAGM